MGMFNSIYADLPCPTRQKISRNTEIQIKWQVREARTLAVYHLGDVLEDIEPEYDNTWIRTDYICGVCSKYTIGRKGMRFIKTEDQSRHFVFVRVERGRIAEILTEEQFKKTGVTEFVEYM
jgi:hypothetical protein